MDVPLLVFAIILHALKIWIFSSSHFQIVRKKEQEEMGELRVRVIFVVSFVECNLPWKFRFQRLRNENRLLKKQNELLEAESTELAHRLVRGQVSRAEEEETAFAIESELMALRKSHVELSHQLETANEEIRGLSLRLQENVSKIPIHTFNVLTTIYVPNNCV